MELKHTIFPVKEVPAYFEHINNKGKLSKELETGHKFIVREDTGEVLSCVTDKYKVVQNQSIVEAAKRV